MHANWRGTSKATLLRLKEIRERFVREHLHQGRRDAGFSLGYEDKRKPIPWILKSGASYPLECICTLNGAVHEAMPFIAANTNRPNYRIKSNTCLQLARWWVWMKQQSGLPYCSTSHHLTRKRLMVCGSLPHRQPLLSKGKECEHTKHFSAPT